MGTVAIAPATAPFNAAFRLRFILAFGNVLA